jgi:phenylpyruvate tautomerase PptA (4-oxalocrotonate tautomerase family)
MKVNSHRGRRKDELPVPIRRPRTHLNPREIAALAEEVVDVIESEFGQSDEAILIIVPEEEDD